MPFSRGSTRQDRESLTTDTGAIQIIDPADSPGADTRTRQTQLLIAALVLGWPLGVGFALLETLDDSIHTTEDAARLVNLPVMGAIPSLGSGSSRKGGALMIRQPDSPQAEAFRFLATICLSSEGPTLEHSRRQRQAEPGRHDHAHQSRRYSRAGRKTRNPGRCRPAHAQAAQGVRRGQRDRLQRCDHGPFADAERAQEHRAGELLLVTAGSAFSNPWQLLRSSASPRSLTNSRTKATSCCSIRRARLLFADAVVSRLSTGLS